MGTYDYRYHLRLDEPTERALEQISRCTFTTKSTLMRHYVSVVRVFGTFERLI